MAGAGVVCCKKHLAPAPAFLWKAAAIHATGKPYTGVKMPSPYPYAALQQNCNCIKLNNIYNILNFVSGLVTMVQTQQ